MDIGEHIASIRREGLLLADAAARVDLDAAIPTCPDWRMRDLVRHVGGIHRWAAMHVREARTRPVNGFAEAVDGWPTDAELIDWFRDGHAGLVEVLEQAAPDVQCWSFLPAPSPLAFWARRQAHETEIHRADAESASWLDTSYPIQNAADGIDELVMAFVARSDGRLTSDQPRSLHVHTTDTEGEWLVRIGPAGAEVSTEHARADCTISGTASELYLVLWNRASTEGIAVEGDASLLDVWRGSVQIRWSD